MKLVRKREAGFTLLELLVVVVILGFLVMVMVPRLGGIIYKGKAGADASNVKEVNQFLQTMANIGALGNVNNALNMVDYDTDNSTFIVAKVETGATTDADSLSTDFVDAYKPCLHKLSKNEVDEFSTLGITSVQNWNDLNPNTHTQYEVAYLEEGTAVVMCGAGNCANATGTDAWEVSDFTNINEVEDNTTSALDGSVLRQWDYVYRILVGFGGPSFPPFVQGDVEPGTGKLSAPYRNTHHQDFVVFAYPRLLATIEDINNSGAPGMAAPGMVCVKDASSGLYKSTAGEKGIDLVYTWRPYGIYNQISQIGPVWPDRGGAGTQEKWVLVDGNASASCGFGGMGAAYIPVSMVIANYGYH